MEESLSDTSPEQVRDYSTPASLSDGWQGSTDAVRGTVSMSDPPGSTGAIDESLSPWPEANVDNAALAEQQDDFQFVLDEQGVEYLTTEAEQIDDFAALWDWEALGLGTFPLDNNV
ncbi:hypothetical protein NQ176_g9041 [Zarea fungicola]|uniref:Uncharacterized protein n=1 Tax=Zarea fungicola TaxID=93591 RepID=A0ACC1MPY1_9HYPO|nr:hypothetical protein NQ176_g9041 [Lecanicillium fungicola]